MTVPWEGIDEQRQLVEQARGQEPEDAPAHLATTWWVFPTFDDRLPLVLRVGMGELVVPSAHHRKAVADGQQFVLTLRISRTRIIECRQDPTWFTHMDQSRGRKTSRLRLENREVAPNFGQKLCHRRCKYV